MQKTIVATFEDAQHTERYLELKEGSRQRIGTDELTNGAFLAMLLDVWEHHLNQESDPFKIQLSVEPMNDNIKHNILRDSGVPANAQTD